jgi:methionine synthase II (cobalamin-independent)
MAWEADKKAALDALVDDVSTRGLVIESLITELKITDNSQKNWLYSSSNSTEVSNLIDFLQKNRVHGVVAVEAINFAKEVVKAGEEGILVSAFPFVKYPVGSNYATLYPKLTEYLKNQLPTIKNNQTIINKIVEYGDLSASEVKSQLEWGKGPEIQIKQLGVHYGLFNGNYPNVLNLDIDLINDLENSTPNSRLANSFAFLVGVTILHEFVHYSEYTDSRWNNPESGELFEIDVYGQTVWRNNASIILKRN